MEVITEHLQSLEQSVNPSTKVTLNISKRADILYIISKNLPKLTREQVQATQTKIEPIFTSLIQTSSTPLIARLIIRIQLFVLEHGNNNRIAELLDNYLRIAVGTKLKVQNRISAMNVIASVFEKFWGRMVTPCIDEIFEITKKIYKTNCEVSLKENAIQMLSRAIASKVMNFAMIRDDTIRLLSRAISDRASEIRHAACLCTIEILKLNPALKGSQFDLFFQGCVKGLEDVAKEPFSDLIIEMFLSNMDFQADVQLTSTKQKLTEGSPRTVFEAISLVAHYFTKQSTSHESRVGMILALKDVLHKGAQEALTTMTDVNFLMDAILSILNKSIGNDFENWRTGEIISSLLCHLCYNSFSEFQLRYVLDYLINKLSTSRAQVQDANVFEMELQPGKKGTVPIVETVVTVCLRSLCPIFYRLPSESVLRQYGDSLYKPILSYTTSGRLSKFSSKALQVLGFHLPYWLSNMLSVLLNYTTISHAELAGLKVGPVGREVLCKAVNALIGNCLTLSSLVRCVPFSLRGVPVDIPSGVLKTAVALISGQYQTDTIEEEEMNADEGVGLECDTARREGGWLLIEGLVYLGPSWVGQRLTLLFSLWKVPFGRRACLVDSKNEVSSTQLLYEFRHKRVASSSLVAFIKNNEALLSNQICKLITVFLINALQFIAPQNDPLKRKPFFQENVHPIEYSLFKGNIFESFSAIPNPYYAHKFIVLLHPICAEIVSDRITVIPTIYKEWISTDDHYLVENTPNNPLYDLSMRTYSESVVNNWLNQGLSKSYTHYVEKSWILNYMMNAAMRVFSEIFASSQLNINNRQQLFKHFNQHLNSVLKFKDMNPIKVFKTASILLTTLGCLRRLVNGCGVITDQDLIIIIRQMFNAVENIPNAYIRTIYGEGLILLCQVMTDPQNVTAFIKEVEHKVALIEHNPSVKAAVVMLIGNMYANFDYVQIERNQQTLGHIIQNISRDNQVGGWAIHVLLKIYSLYGNKVINIVQATFPLAYFHYINDYKGEFNFKETMLKISVNHLMIAEDKSDETYIRSMLIWDDIWETDPSLVLKVLPQMLKNGLEFDLPEAIERSVANVNSANAVEFLSALIAKGNGMMLLDKLPVLFQSISSDSARPLIDEIFQIAAIVDIKRTILTLKSVISGVTKRSQQANIAIMAEDDDEEEKQAQPTAAEPEEYDLTDYPQNTQTKLVCTELIHKILRLETDLSRLEPLLETCIQIGFNLCSSESDELKVWGLRILKLLCHKFRNIADPEDSRKLLLEIYEAQISTSLRPQLESSAPEVVIEALKLMYAFVMTPATQDRIIIQRMIPPLIDSFTDLAIIPMDEDYSEDTSARVYFTKLQIIAKLIVNSLHGGQCRYRTSLGITNDLSQYFEGKFATLKKHMGLAIKDASVIFTQPKRILKEHSLALKYPVVEQESKGLSRIEFLFWGLSLMLQEDDIDEIELITSCCLTFLFLPYNVNRESSKFLSQREMELFIIRRETILEALNISIGFLSEEKLLLEIVHALEICMTDPVPHPRLVNILSQIIDKLTQSSDIRRVERMILTSYVKNPTEVCITAWSKCVKSYAAELTGDFADIEGQKCSIIDFFKEAAKLGCWDITVETLGEIQNICEDVQFKAYIAIDVIQSMISHEQYAYAMQFLSTLEDFNKYGQVIEGLKSRLLKWDKESGIIIDLLRKYTDRQIAAHLLPTILLIFKDREAYDDAKTICLSNGLKLLLQLYSQAEDKNKTAQLILPFLLGCYITNVPIVIIQGVSKALQSIAATAPQALKNVIMEMPVHEQKFLQQMLTQAVQAPAAAQQASAVSEKPRIELKIKSFK